MITIFLLKTCCIVAPTVNYYSSKVQFEQNPGCLLSIIDLRMFKQFPGQMCLNGCVFIHLSGVPVPKYVASTGFPTKGSFLRILLLSKGVMSAKVGKE